MSKYEFADDAEFRIDGLSYSVWTHDDATKNHVKVTIARATLDDYVRAHGHKLVVDMLNARIKDQVHEAINRAIDEGRPMAASLELDLGDLTGIFGAPAP